MLGFPLKKHILKKYKNPNLLHISLLHRKNRQKLIKYQQSCNEAELLAERMKQTERELANIKKEANNYQNMLQQSQAQYGGLEKKYGRVKKILREYQHRERDMVRVFGTYLK